MYVTSTLVHPAESVLSHLMESMATDMATDTSAQATGSSGVERRPALHGAAEFVSWTWEMINAGAECAWSSDGTEIVVSNPEKLQADVIPVYFRHGQARHMRRPALSWQPR